MDNSIDGNMSLSFEKCVHAEHTNSKKTAVNKRKQLTMESGPPRPRRMTCPDSFRILEDKTQTSPKIPEADLSPADNSMADTSTRTPEPTFRHNRRRQNNSVSKIFSTMILNSLPRKTKGDRTPIRQLKRRKMRRANFVLGSPFSFGSCDSSSFGVSPSHCSLSSSLESTCSPRPEQPKKVTPCNPKKLVAPDRPLKQRPRIPRSLSAHFIRTPWGNPSPACPMRSTSTTPSDQHELNWTKKDFVQLVADLKRKGIRLLTLDWDNTFISIHTKNGWYGGAEQLSRWVRDPFRDLVRAALKGGIFVAVVTFSIQTDLIVDALKHVFPKCCKKIPVFGNDERWACSSAMMTKFYKRKGTRLVGKLPHMCAAAAASVKKKCIKPITFSDVLLIDDDKNNIKTARGQGVRACWLCQDSPNAIFWNLKCLS